MNSEYRFRAHEFEVTNEMKQAFDENGFILVRGLLDSRELEHVKDAVENKDGVIQHAYNIDDGKGRKIRMSLWGHPGNDVTGMLARSGRVVNTASRETTWWTRLSLSYKTDDETARNSFAWHQDYGYWYHNACLYADMLTMFLPIDPCQRNNGCLQFIKGSHKCGGIDHMVVGGQNGADLDRVNHLLDSGLEKIHLEMSAGDAVFFHCNLLHCSDPNDSPQRRWSLAVSFNKATNNPMKEHHCPQYTPLVKVPDSAILDCTNVTNLEGKSFIDPKKDDTIIYDENNQ